MDVRFRYEGNRISLVQHDESLEKDERNVVAGMTHFEGTSCWMLVDVRLSKYKTPNRFGANLDGNVTNAHYLPRTPEEREVVISMLREYREYPDGTIMWCSFEGIVRGSPTVNGKSPGMFFEGPECAGFFSRKDGLEKLKEIKSFWDAYTGGDWRIENPHRQATESDVYSATSPTMMALMAAKKLEEEAEVAADAPSTPRM